MDELQELQELQEQYNKLQESFQNNGKKILAQQFKKLFSYGYLNKITWNQYTPSFNDGSPCSFTLSGPLFGFREEYHNDEKLMDSFGEEDENLFYFYSFKMEKILETLPQDQQDFLNALKNFITFFESDMFSDLAEKVLGNYVTVSFDGNNIEIEDYEY